MFDLLQPTRERPLLVEPLFIFLVRMRGSKGGKTRQRLETNINKRSAPDFGPPPTTAQLSEADFITVASSFIFLFWVRPPLRTFLRLSRDHGLVYRMTMGVCDSM